MTYGLAVVMVVAVSGPYECWPVTSFRLFSQTRTGTTTTYALLVEEPGGRFHRVSFGPRRLQAEVAGRQVRTLVALPADRRQARIDALLTLAHTGPGAFRPLEGRAVRVERVTRRVGAGGGPGVELGRRIVLRVDRHPTP